MNPRFLPRFIAGIGIALALSSASVFGILSEPQVARAQDDSLAAIGETTGFGNDDPQLIIARLIRNGLSLLGVVALCICLYGGFVWMTAAGNPEKVDRAKRILINGGIGLAIILLSWTISMFVVRALTDATNPGSGGSSGGGGGGALGGGSSTSFVVSNFSPEGAVDIRNVALRVTFSQAVEASTAEGAVTVANATTGEAVEGTLTVSGNRVTFVPTAACPEPNEDRFCFDADTTYTVTVADTLESTSGRSLQCGGDACTSSFTTGSNIDTQDPVATFVYPDSGDSVASSSTVPLQVAATDDTQVADGEFVVGESVLGSVAASGDNLTDVMIESTWETDGLQDGERYRVTVTISDIAGNTDTDSVTVRARPATCSNGVLDADLGETDVDCGGDNASATYCGACEGGSCTDASECASGNCTDGQCVAQPEITSVSPDNGAVGTYVTIIGSGFGRSAGSVRFGSVEAEVLTACGDGGWSDDQILVQVPEGADDGAISVTTSTGETDATDDENGVVFADFDVNTTNHPSLCSLSPNTGDSGEVVTLSGSGFGASRGSSEVNFGAREASAYAGWSNTELSVTVPSASDDVYEVTVVVDGQISNALQFAVQSTSTDQATVVDVSPSEGGIGQYVTLSGTGFGSSIGRVTFRSTVTGEETVASVDFPRACSSAYWSSGEVTVIVPDGLDEGEYAVFVTPRGGDASTEVTFTVTDADPTPGICAIDPDGGEAGDDVVIYGDNFGSSGSVTFTSGVAATATAWDDQEIAVSVPSGAVTGSVVVTRGGLESNEVDFVVGATAAEGSDADSEALFAAYAWTFSTGEIPDVPEVVTECSNDRVSAVPNSRFTDDGDVCVNAVVFAEFTTTMDASSVEDALVIERCADADCEDAESVPGLATVTTGASASSVTWVPATSTFDEGTKYRVTIGAAAASTDGAAMGEDVVWTFTTRESSDDCVVDRVVVSPSEEFASAANDLAAFQALPVTGCVVTDAADYAWEWSLDSYSYADFNADADASCDGEPSACATVEALAEGEVVVSASVTGGGESGSAVYSINFTDPYVAGVFPDCTEACTNAAVGARFNIAMEESTISSTNIQLYRCANELCSSLERVEDAVPSCTYSEGNACTGFTFDDVTLAVSTFYRVVITSDVTSSSGVALTRPNYGTDYSWTFRVREDAAVCAVDRISLEPSSVRFTAIGASQSFAGSAYGEADSCSTSGQLLSASDFNWTWTNPIEDDPDNTSSETLAAWFNDAQVDSDVSSIAPGCSALCVAAGSQEYQAICGNNEIEQDATGAGEDCDDGNTTSGDGCSASCQREGVFDGGTCGDGVLDRDASGAGEDCDDGNTTSGDGCSSTCIAEGASSVEATCGNNDIAAASTGAGEECDDGNAQNGDGCSRECVREGSVTSAALGGAMCGDGEITSPYETCDDGNTASGDGCSSSCVREGYKSGVSVCGNNETERDATTGAGEDCDGQEGCTDACTFAGSSADYSEPSFCGDGAVGLGELAECENGATGDGNIDALQVAYVTEGAVYEVNPETREARAVVEVTEESSGLSVTAELSLACVAERDSECSDAEVYGVGIGGCCMERPEVALYPAEGVENVCLNASLYGEFTEQMDTSTFVYTSDDGVRGYRMYARWEGSGTCPHTTALAYGSKSVAVRMWQRVRDFFTGASASATVSGECIVPIAGFSQVPVVVTNSDGTTSTTYKVVMRYAEALEPSSTYTLVIEGDDNVADDAVDGVLSRLGVGVYGTQETSFTTGSEICAIDEVIVSDANEESPNVFTQTNEAHAFVATAVARVDGTAQEIEPIDGVYAWEWTSWSSRDEEIVSVEQDETYPEAAVATAEGVNGETTLSAVATITDDSSGGSVGDTFVGTQEVMAFLCENPWPELSKFPWSDDETGLANGQAVQGRGFMHFSVSYCRDAGSDDDLPSVSVVYAPSSGDANVMKEYFFQVNDGSSDAIGVRIVSNANYMSPLEWYDAQGFVGNPSETEVDGFAAIVDGRTTYVAAPNVNAGTIYPNIYVLSYNEGASDSTMAIYDQMLANVSFLIDQSDERICYVDGVATATSCTSDFDCSEVGGTCATDKLALQRDMRRLTDLTDIAGALEQYSDDNAAIPALSSGTYVRSLAASTWTSWSDIFGGALDARLPTDPLNAYVECGATSSEYSSYDAATCVDVTRGEYVCPDGSYAYHYRAVGSTGYTLSAELEYDGATWFGDVDSDATDAYEISANLAGASFCDGAVYGTSSLCGDGVVGGDEVCEIGQLGDAEVCEIDGVPGYIDRECNSTCSGWVDREDAECVPASCGNGLVEGDEQCDDGALNGRYGYCGTQCTFASGSYCGDGEVSGSEACDCGDATLTDSTILGNARAYGGGAGSCGDNRNGDYGSNPNTTCSWDCQGPASYCGDGVIDSGESCDGGTEYIDGSVCNGFSGAYESFPCETDDDCGGTFTFTVSGTEYEIATCGGSGYNACTPGNVCLSGDADMIGRYCYSDASCGSGGLCSTDELPTYRSRTCNNDGANGDTCTLTEASSYCMGLTACGNGIIEDGEECDDGNDDSTDSCTNACTVNVCGDGYLYAGEEQCDEGTANGDGCSSAYGSTCTACSLTCRYEVASGAFCGDGEVNGDEYCDGTSVPYTYYREDTGEVYEGAFGNCDAGDPAMTVSGVEYTCTRVGVCDGGVSGSGVTAESLNGTYCVSDSTCGGGSCVFPSCNDDCESACPLTETSTTLSLTTNQPGAAARQSVSLYSYSSESTANIPNAATVTIPACSAATSLVADVSFDGVTPPDVYVVFVTDTSGSMRTMLGDSDGDGVLDESRMTVAKELLTDAIGELYDDLGETVQIGLVHYSSTVTTDSGFVDEDEESTLITAIAAYSETGATYTDEAIDAAKAMLDAVADDSNVRKIAVLLTDGEPSTHGGVSGETLTTNAVSSFLYDTGYELYSIALTTDSDLIANMNGWSSNRIMVTSSLSTTGDYNSRNLIDYSYYGSSVDDLESAYEQIVDSITSATAVIYATFDGTTYTSRGTVGDSANVQLPWPTGFSCDPDSEQDIPVQITFGGQGQIEVSNVRLEYCAP